MSGLPTLILRSRPSGAVYRMKYQAAGRVPGRLDGFTRSANLGSSTSNSDVSFAGGAASIARTCAVEILVSKAATPVFKMGQAWDRTTFINLPSSRHATRMSRSTLTFSNNGSYGDPSDAAARPFDDQNLKSQPFRGGDRGSISGTPTHSINLQVAGHLSHRSPEFSFQPPPPPVKSPLRLQ